MLGLQLLFTYHVYKNLLLKKNPNTESLVRSCFSNANPTLFGLLWHKNRRWHCWSNTALIYSFLCLLNWVITICNCVIIFCTSSTKPSCYCGRLYSFIVPHVSKTIWSLCPDNCFSPGSICFCMDPLSDPVCCIICSRITNGQVQNFSFIGWKNLPSVA